MKVNWETGYKASHTHLLLQEFAPFTATSTCNDCNNYNHPSIHFCTTGSQGG